MIYEVKLNVIISKTDSNNNFVLAENVLYRYFTSTQLGEKRVSDIPYIKVCNQWKYITTVLGLANEK